PLRVVGWKRDLQADSASHVEPGGRWCANVAQDDLAAGGAPRDEAGLAAVHPQAGDRARPPACRAFPDGRGHVDREDLSEWSGEGVAVLVLIDHVSLP